MPSLLCLISALTQAGGGDLLFRFASSVQSCCGEGRALQANVAVYGKHSPCSGQAAKSFGGFSPGAASLFPPWRAVQAARGLRVLSPGAARLFPPRPQRAPPFGSQEVFRQEQGPICQVRGGGFSGAEFAPCPSPRLLPPAGMGQLFSGVSQSPCFANAGGVFRPVNFSSLSHSLKNHPPTALRAFWPVPTLRNAAGSSPFRPHLLVAGAGVWGTFLLGVAFRQVICGPYLISPPS